MLLRKRRRTLKWAGGFVLVLSLNLLATDRGMAAPWQLEPRLTVSERYDDNILLIENDPETDAVTTVMPGLLLVYKESAIKLTAQYDAVIERYIHHPDLDNVGHNGSVEFVNDRFLGSKKTSISLKDTFQNTPQIQGTVAGLPITGTGVGLPRNDTWINTAALGLTRLSTARLTERIEYLNSLVRFEDPTLIDSTTHEGDFEVTYQLDPKNEFTSVYRFRYFDFVQETADNGIDQVLLVGLTHRFSPSLFLTAKLGPSYSIQSGTWYITPVGMLRFSKLFEKLTIGAEYSREISVIAGLSTQLVTSQTVSSDLTYTLTKKFSAMLGAGFADNEALTGEESTIVSWNIRAGLSYQILKWLFAEIRYLHFEQRATGNSGNDFKQNQYIFGLTSNFQ